MNMNSSTTQLQFNTEITIAGLYYFGLIINNIDGNN